MAVWPDLKAWKTPACFFMISVAYTIGWTAISSELSYYTAVFGPHMLLLLNAAYFLPSVPVLALQTVADHHFDRWFGVAASTATRFIVGLGGSALLCAAFPFYPANARLILGVVALLGVCAGIAFGSSYQLVSRFGPRETVALTTGFVGSGPLVILADLVLRIGPRPSFHQRLALYSFVTLVTCIGLVAGVHLLRRHWSELDDDDADQRPPDSPSANDTMGARSSLEVRRRGGGGGGAEIIAFDGLVARSRSTLVREHGSAAAQQILAMEAGRRQHLEREALLADARRRPQSPANGTADSLRANSGGSGGSDNCGSAASFSTAELARALAPAAVGLFLSASTAVLLFPFFSYVRTNGRMDAMLPQVLFGARVIADILGRITPKAAWIQTRRGILLTGVARAAATPLFFMYIYGWLPPLDDAVVVAYVAVFWFTSGYCNTCAYLMAPRMVPPAAAPRAGGLMALVFQAASLAALGVAFGIQAWRAPPGSGPALQQPIEEFLLQKHVL